MRGERILGKEWPGAAYVATKADAVNVDARTLSSGRVRALHGLGVEVSAGWPTGRPTGDGSGMPASTGS